MDSFWQANLELCDIEPELNLYNFNWPICTYQTQLPPAKFIFDDAERCGCATDSLISSGCVISGARVKRSVISSATRIESFSRVERSVVLPMVTIGRNCRIIDTILDKGCVVPDGTVIGEDRDEDGKHYHVTPSGIRLVTPAMLGQDRDSTEERLVD